MSFTAPAAAPVNPGNDLMAIIIASLIPLLGGLSHKQQHSEPPVQGCSHKHLYCESPRSLTSKNPMTPQRSRHLFPSTPKHIHHSFDTSPQPTGISSPPHAIHSPVPVALVPAPGLELHVCLHDFAAAETIDMTEFRVPLSMEEYTPGHILFAEDSDLHVITGAPGGWLVALKIFFCSWQIQYKGKIMSGSYSIYHPKEICKVFSYMFGPICLKDSIYVTSLSHQGMHIRSFQSIPLLCPL